MATILGMRALQITRWHQEAELVEVEVPVPGPGQVVVKVGAPRLLLRWHRFVSVSEIGR